VFKLAEELGIQPDEVVAICNRLGVPITSQRSLLTPKVADMVRNDPAVRKAADMVRTDPAVMTAKYVRVRELADELGVPPDEVVEVCHMLGVGVKGETSTLQPAYADMIRKRILRERPEPKCRECGEQMNKDGGVCLSCETRRELGRDKRKAASLYFVWAEAFVSDNLLDPNIGGRKQDLVLALDCGFILREIEERAEKNRTEVKFEAFKELLNVLRDIPAEEFNSVISEMLDRISRAPSPIFWFNSAPDAWEQLLEWKFGQRTHFDFRSGR